MYEKWIETVTDNGISKTFQKLKHLILVNLKLIYPAVERKMKSAKRDTISGIISSWRPQNRDKKNSDIKTKRKLLPLGLSNNKIGLTLGASLD